MENFPIDTSSRSLDTGQFENTNAGQAGGSPVRISPVKSPKALKILGVSEEEFKRSKALSILGSTESDYKKSLTPSRPPRTQSKGVSYLSRCSVHDAFVWQEEVKDDMWCERSKRCSRWCKFRWNKAYKILGCDEHQLKRLKALEILGVTDLDIQSSTESSQFRRSRELRRGSCQLRSASS